MHTALSSRFLRKLLGIGLVPLLLLTVSCSTLGKPKNNEKDLLQAEQDFIKAMRWGDYKQASIWLAPGAKEDFWKTIDRFQNHLHITDYDIRDVIFENGDFSNVVLLRCRYYYTCDPELKTKTLRQKWVYSETLPGWQLQQHGLGALLVE